MNNRDLQLYSYLKEKGGGPTPPGPTIKWPRLINHEHWTGARWVVSYPFQKTFTLQKDDVILICLASEATPTFPAGFTVVSQCTSGLILTIAKYICPADETRTFKVSQSKESRMGGDVLQLRNCDIYGTTDFNSTGNSRQYSFPSTLPFIFAMSNSSSDSTQMGMLSNQSTTVKTIANAGTESYCLIRVFLNFGSYNKVETYELKGSSSIATTGVYLVDPNA